MKYELVLPFDGSGNTRWYWANFKNWNRSKCHMAVDRMDYGLHLILRWQVYLLLIVCLSAMKQIHKNLRIFRWFPFHFQSRICAVGSCFERRWNETKVYETNQKQAIGPVDKNQHLFYCFFNGSCRLRTFLPFTKLNHLKLLLHSVQ